MSNDEAVRKSVKQFVTSALRRASYRWPPRYMTLKRAHKARNAYECEKCKGIFPKKEVQLDHIIPVVDPLKGFTNFDDYVYRMFAADGGWSVLCTGCHDTKTQEENGIRRGVKVKKERPKKVKKKASKKARRK